jgi:hypothetical protein
LNDRDLADVVERDFVEVISGAIAADEIHDAIVLLGGLCAKRRGPPADGAITTLLDEVWVAAHEPRHVEMIARLRIARAGGADVSEEIDRTVQAYRQAAASAEGLQQFVALRAALRIAEELGHPDHQSIVHEIETLDVHASMTPIRVEQTIGRDVIAAFCLEIVGDDSLLQGLRRFGSHMWLSPSAVQKATESPTRSGLLSSVPGFRLGEANSILTSSTHHPGGASEDAQHALRRDAVHEASRAAQIGAFIVLVPALHELLDAYHPSDEAGLEAALSAGCGDAVSGDAFARGLEHFRNRRYDEAAHVVVPRIERVVRLLARSAGVATTKRPTARVGGVRSLGEILSDLKELPDQSVLPEPLVTAAELTLVDPDGLNLRNDVSHGVTDEVRAVDAVHVLQLAVAISIGRTVLDT